MKHYGHIMKYYGHFSSMIYKFFDRGTSGWAIKNEILSNKELAEELHKLIIRKSEKSTLIFYRQYERCGSSRDAIDK